MPTNEQLEQRRRRRAWWLRVARETRGLSQSGVADSLGLSKKSASTVADSIGSFKAIGQPFAGLGLKCASSPLANGQPRVLCDFPTKPGASVELIATSTSQGQLLASLGILFDPAAPTAQETAALQLFLADADAIANQQASAWFNPQLSVYTNANTETKTLVDGTFGTVQLIFTGIAGAVLLTVRVPQ